MRISDWSSDVCSSDLQLKLIDRVKGVCAPGIGSVDVEERPLRIAVVRHHPAVGERQVEQAAVVLGGQQMGVAEVPLIVRSEVRIIGADGEFVVSDRKSVV